MSDRAPQTDGPASVPDDPGPGSPPARRRAAVDEPSPGQQAILGLLDRLADLELGGAEPAVTFDPSAWRAGPARFDLAAAARAAAARRDRGGADGTADRTPGGGGGALPGGDDGGLPGGGDGGLPGRDDGGLPGGDAGALPAIDPCAGVVETVAAVAAGRVDPTRLVDEALERIEACNPLLGAVVALSRERALETARRLAAGGRGARLAGVPILHKDILCTRGVRTAAGSRLLDGHVPDADATVVQRLEKAGTLMVGKANTHEFATGTTGTVSADGPVRNPWNRRRIAGGSSSGSAAAVAAGIVPAATGTDTGGSIRIPAACCGIVGLKPTYGRVSRAGVVPFAWSLDHVGPMARSVRDVAALLEVMAGGDPADLAAREAPPEDPVRELERGVEGIRFGLLEELLDGVQPDVAAAVRHAAGVLEELGATRVEVPVPAVLDHIAPVAVAIFLSEGGAVHAETLRASPDLYQAETRAFLSLAPHVDGPRYARAQALRAGICFAFGKALGAADLLLTPTLPVTAPALDARTVALPGGDVDVRSVLTTFTRPFNLTGFPALSLPCGFDADGLPVGLQIVGRPFEEATVLRAGHAYEQAAGWVEQRPGQATGRGAMKL